MSIWTNRNWQPMLLKEIDKPFDSKEYLFEIKYDGIRACIFVSNNTFEIKTRNNHTITHLFPELIKIKKLIKKDTIIDGEIIIMGKNGPSFKEVSKRMHLKNRKTIEFESINNPVIFVGFDILYQNKELTNLNILERKKILDKIKENDVFIKSKIYLYDGIKLFNTIKKHNLEGIVAKKIDSDYQINTRSNNWIKIKNNKEEIFIVGGYINKKNNYISVLLGEIKNNKLYYVGNASMTKKNKNYNKIINSKIGKNLFINHDKDANYINTKIKCKVKYLERTDNNHLRQPIIKDV